jgi:hypothetical protein
VNLRQMKRFGWMLTGLLTVAIPATAGTKTESPFACVESALNPAERKQHFDEYGPKLRQVLTGIRELPTGYEFTFKNDAATYQILSAWMYQERLCCPFFDLDLTIAREGGALGLRLTGREGVKEFIAAEFEPWFQKAKAKS